jgi:hypothetical protein
MNTHQLYRSVARIRNQILDSVNDRLRPRRGVLAPIVLVIDRSEDRTYRRRSR